MELNDNIIELIKIQNKQLTKKVYENNISIIRNKEQYINTHNGKVIEILQKAFLNVLRLDENQWENIDGNYYYDFFQVRDENKYLKFTYTFEKYEGIAIRRYNAREPSTMNITQIGEFLDNEKAVKKLNKITGQPNFINDIKQILPKCEKIDFETTKEYYANITLSDKEQIIIGKGHTLSFNIRTCKLKSNIGIDYTGYDVNDINNIIGKIFLINHKPEILKTTKSIINKITKMELHCRMYIDDINTNLAKWLMLEAF